MLGWFSPKCPVDTWEKAWTETRMRWLADQFGIDRLLNAEVILPTEQYFPDPFAGTEADARRLLDLVCGYMDVDPGRVELEVCADVQLPGAAGHYHAGERAVIRVAQSQLANPERLAATLTHEVSHELLLGQGRLAPEVADHEWVTDLLPAFLGIGIFAANAVLDEEYVSHGQWSWWRMGKQGYLPARMFGYAFALFAFVRDERDPPWASYLRLDASAALKGGLRYLRKTNDTLFRAESIRAARHPPSVGELASRLQAGSPSARLGAVWEVREHSLTAAELVPPLVDCLRNQDEHLSGEAARTLAQFGTAAEPAVALLLDAVLLDGRAGTRAGAAYALGGLRARPEEAVPALGTLLEDRDADVVCAAAWALRQFGPSAAPAASRLLNALRAATLNGEHTLIDLLAGTLLAVVPDPERQIREHFGPDERELRRLALESIREQRAAL